MDKNSYIPLKDLDIYKLARELSKIGWGIYEVLNWQDKKIVGDQFMRSIDSVGANIAEGYSRYHYLDRIKFYYTSRASLAESCDHWLELLYERHMINYEKYVKIKDIKQILSIKLNNFISTTYKSKNNKFL